MTAIELFKSEGQGNDGSKVQWDLAEMFLVYQYHSCTTAWLYYILPRGSSQKTWSSL